MNLKDVEGKASFFLNHHVIPEFVPGAVENHEKLNVNNRYSTLTSRT
jgi:hypothetical protein